MRAFILALAVAACSQQTEQAADAPVKAAPPAQPSVAAEPAPPTLTPQQSLAAMPSWETARAAGVDFRAVGQEPGWLLDIYARGVVKFAWDYGDHYAEFAVAEPTHPQEGVTRYEAHSDGYALVVIIRRTPCQDGMSGQSYPTRVEAIIDGRTLNGCGRSV
jgi:uncharacterized membrane protein